MRKQEAGSRKQETGSRKQEAGSRKQEAGSRKQETGSRKQEAGSRKQEAPLISVVIPMYNVEKYLRNCLDSLLAQTYTKWEGIIVNDGSPDHCSKIASEYVKMDTRFSLYEKQNGGIGSARNAGLKYCSGKYTFFLDSDDLLHPEAFERLLKTAEETDSDITACCLHFDEFPDQYLSEKMGKFQPYESTDPLTDILAGKVSWGHFAHSRIYKSSTICGMTFAENVRTHEDTFWDIEALDRSTKIAHLPLPLYLYRKNPDSLTHTTPSDKELFAAFHNCLQAQNLIVPKEKYKTFSVALYEHCGMSIFWHHLKIILMTGNREQTDFAEKCCQHAVTHGWYDLWKEKLTLSSRIAIQGGKRPCTRNLFRWLWKVRYGSK